MNRAIVLIVAGLAVMTTLACDAGNLVAFARATETPTRTPRPTFTPRVVATPTPEDTPTPEATATSAASPTPTKRPVVATARPPTAKPPAPPPQPQFAWKQSPSSNQGRCDAGPGVYEVKGRIHDGKQYVGGIHVVVLDKDGKIVAQIDSRPDTADNPLNIEWGVSCFEEKNKFNYQLDISAGRATGPLTLRLTRSATDLTPISFDVKIDVSTGGRWYIDWTQ